MIPAGPRSDADFAFRRAALGICSILMLVAGSAVFAWGGEDARGTAAPVFLRMALVLGAMWLALPELRGLSKSVSGKGTMLLTLGLLLASLSKASVVPLTMLGGVALAVYGIKAGWRWLWEPMPSSRQQEARRSAPGAPDSDTGSRD